MSHQQKTEQAGGKSFLSYFNLSSHYERVARLLPGLLCAMTLLPVAAAFGLPVQHYLALAATGLGIWAACGVGISHLASAAGNRIQRKLWPRWPFDSPTNLWLHPDNHTRSSQHKELLYAAIKRLTHLDIKAAAKQGAQELETTINDAISRLRYQLRSSRHGDRLDIHNAQYGFARNLAGLRPLWLGFLLISMLGCWIANARHGGATAWGIVSTALVLGSIPVSFCITRYVHERSWHYAESFFSAVLELDSAEQAASHQHKSQPKNPKPRSDKSTKRSKHDA